MAFKFAKYSIPLYPEFSASEIGITSNASAKALIAYWSMVLVLSALSATYKEQETSVAPPPYTILLFFNIFLTTQRASWRHRLASSTIIDEPPLTKIVTAFFLGQSSITIIFWFFVPTVISLITRALPNFSFLISEKLFIILPPVAKAICSISAPPTHLTEGSPLCIKRWFASSSKPHWHMTKLAPLSFTFWTMVLK